MMDGISDAKSKKSDYSKEVDKTVLVINTEIGITCFTVCSLHAIHVWGSCGVQWPLGQLIYWVQANI